MADLWTVLGYDTVAQDIAVELERSADLQIIEGPAGIGKSWLAAGIGEQWVASGGVVLEAKGDSGQGSTSYYPFRRLSNLLTPWSVISPLATGAVQVGEAFLPTRGAIGTTIDVLTRIRRERSRSRAAYFGVEEQEILHKLEQLGKKKPILLIADNLHWWDEKSLDLLRRLRDPELQAGYAVLQAMRVVAVQTPRQETFSPRAFGNLLAMAHAHHHTLERIPQERFRDVLIGLGASPSLAPATADTIYRLTGGHLELASRTAEYIASRGTENLLSVSDRDGFMRALLVERLRFAEVLEPQALELLRLGAVLGLEFAQADVMCASPGSEQDTARLLRLCREERLLLQDKSLSAYRFAHDVLRQFFMVVDVEDKVGIHERLLECSQRLRPADYDFRCLNALNAERPSEASVLAVQAAIQRAREGGNWRSAAPRYVLDAIRSGALELVVERLVAARRAVAESRFQECLNLLDSIPRYLPRPLLAESDYIRALCLLATRNEDDHTAARACLGPWVEDLDEEPELQLRLMLLLHHGLTLLFDKTEAHMLGRRIELKLGERASFDLRAKDELYRLSRSASAVHSPEVALMRVREATEYFGSAEGEQIVRRPVEYYRCLVNLTACYLSVAQYVKAAETYRQLTALVAAFQVGTFTMVEVARTNGLLADYRLGRIDATEAVRRQQDLVDQSTAHEDPFYISNALAVYLALNGNHHESLKLYDELDARLASLAPNPQPSMLYLIRANRCCVRFVAGIFDPASLAEWNSLQETVARVEYPIQRYLARRHELLTAVLTSNAAMSAKEFDERLLMTHPDEFGPLWKNFGRGFRMPEIELWSE